MVCLKFYSKYLFYFLGLVILSLGLLVSCTQGRDRTPLEDLSLEERGRRVFQAKCIACHSINTKQDGSLGPALYGVPLEVFKAKTLTGRYPEGYQATRTSRVMPAMPEVKEHIEALHRFVNQD